MNFHSGLWKNEDFEIWKLTLQAMQHSTEDGKKKTFDKKNCCGCGKLFTKKCWLQKLLCCLLVVSLLVCFCLLLLLGILQCTLIYLEYILQYIQRSQMTPCPMTVCTHHENGRDKPRSHSHGACIQPLGFFPYKQAHCMHAHGGQDNFDSRCSEFEK